MNSPYRTADSPIPSIDPLRDAQIRFLDEVTDGLRICNAILKKDGFDSIAGDRYYTEALRALRELHDHVARQVHR